MANGPADLISIGRALAKLYIAKAFRRTVNFTHRGGTTYTLKCHITGDWTESANNGGVLEERRYLTLSVTANQAGLQPPAGDPEAVIVGDTGVVSKYANRTYTVTDKIKIDPGGRVYELTLLQVKRLGSGV